MTLSNSALALATCLSGVYSTCIYIHLYFIYIHIYLYICTCIIWYGQWYCGVLFMLWRSTKQHVVELELCHTTPQPGVGVVCCSVMELELCVAVWWSLESLQHAVSTTWSLQHVVELELCHTTPQPGVGVVCCSVMEFGVSTTCSLYNMESTTCCRVGVVSHNSTTAPALATCSSGACFTYT